MNICKRVLVILMVSICCIGCDQASKRVASEHFPRNTMSSFLGDTVRIGYTENRGAFLGLGKNLPEQTRFYLFTVLVGIFLAVFLLYLACSKPVNLYTLMALSCIWSGGASNLYDRATNKGAVVDFLNVGVGPIRTGIFNIADMAILFGVIVFIFASYRSPEADDYRVD